MRVLVIRLGSLTATPAFLASTGTSLADQTAAECQAAELKAAGKKAVAKLECEPAAISKGIAVDADCLAKAEEKLSDTFAKIQAKGGCARINNATQVEADVDSLVQQVMAHTGSCSASGTFVSPATCCSGICSLTR